MRAVALGRESARSVLGISVTLVALLSGCSSEEGEVVDEGLRALAAWQDLPVPGQRRYRQVSTTDPLKKAKYPLADPGNKDFNNIVATCGERPALLLQEQSEPERCEEGIEGYVFLAEDEGPGFISRMTFAISSPVQAPSIPGPGPRIAGLGDEVIRIYVDDLSAPAYEGKLIDWAESKDELFAEPFTGWRSGMIVSYLPISFRRKVRVVLDELSPQKLHYLNVAVQRIAEATLAFSPARLAEDPLLAEARALLSGAEQGDPNPDARLVLEDHAVEVPPGATVSVLDHEGAGALEGLDFTVGKEVPLADLRGLILEARFDEQAAPAIDVLLLALFGCEEELVPYYTLPMQVRDAQDAWVLSIDLPMPFARRAQLALRSSAAREVSVRVSAGLGAQPGGAWGHLHAVHREQRPPVTEQDRYLIAEASGHGRYVGTVTTMVGKRDEENLYPQPLNFLEGDEIGEVDGEERWQGTGTEDYFNGGWYYWNGPYSYAFSAAPRVYRDVEGPDGVHGAASQQRWHILGDAIDFQRSFSLRVEYGANRPTVLTRYSSVALHYQR